MGTQCGKFDKQHQWLLLLVVQRPTLEHPVTNKYVCGVKGTYRSGRVVGGEDATPGEWCWQVGKLHFKL